ncbi:hypothetical protein CFC21_068961 [Triticum aestivum]|uniref:Uncharacterized protein n=2 Tax=Triticum aestivum TaxID=4565 RepID=A0A9R1HAF6_WHEAT|nr:hypothetical protein CFC21_068961 [Triticum aestivum]
MDGSSPLATGVQLGEDLAIGEVGHAQARLVRVVHHQQAGGRWHPPRHDHVGGELRGDGAAVLERVPVDVRLLQLQAVLEVPQHVAHGRPVRAVVGQAPLGRLGELAQRVVVHLAGDPGVGDLVELPLPVHPDGPLGDVDLVAVQALVDDRARAEHLEEHHAEGVDVGAVRELLRLEVFGVEVPEAALDGRADVRLPQRRPDARETEVGHLGDDRAAAGAAAAVGAEEDVGGLDVAVDDVLGVAAVQVVQAPGGADADLEPLLPRERRLVVGAAVQVAPQRALLHVLVHQNHLRLLVAVADERDEVPVPDAGQHHDLRVELRQALLGGAHGALHSHGRAVRERALVHVAEPADADEVAVVEVVRGGLELRQRDVQLGAHPLHPGGGALAGPVRRLVGPAGDAFLRVR